MTATTWNPTDKSTSIALYDGNATAMMNVFTGPYQEGVRATSSKSAGLFVYEVAVGSFAELAFCIGVAAGDPDYGVGSALSDGVAWGINGAGEIFDNTTILATYTALADGDRVQIAVDCDNGYGWVLVNGALANGGTLPLDVSNADFTSITGAVFPAVSSVYGGPSLAGHWLEENFEFSVPPGALAWDDGIAPPTEIEQGMTIADVGEVGSGQYHHVAAEALIASSSLSVAVTGAAADSLVATATTTQARGARVAQGLIIGPALTAHWHHGQTVVQNARVSREQVVGSVVVHARESITAADVLVAAAITPAAAPLVAADLVTAARLARSMGSSVASFSDLVTVTKIGTVGAGGTVTDSVQGRRTVRATVVDAIAASAAVPTFVSSAAVLGSTLVVSDVVAGRWTAHHTATDVVDAEDHLRLPGAVPAFFTNSHAAAATWTGMPFNSIVAVDGVLYGAGLDGIHRIGYGSNDNGTPIRTRLTGDLVDMGNMQKKRLVSAYATARARKPFTVVVASYKGRWSYKTNPIPTREVAVHRAPLGRGLEFTSYRFSLVQTDDFLLDALVVEHEIVNRRI